MAVPPPPSDQAPPVIVPRWVQLVMLPLAILALYTIARAAGAVLLVFIVAAVIALILNPLVSLVQRTRLPRTLCVIGVYLAFFMTVALAGVLLADPIADQVTAFQADVPDLVDEANDGLHEVQLWLDDRGVDIELERQGETALETLQKQILEGSGEIVSLSTDILREVVEVGFYLVLVIVVSIYMLIYAPGIGRLVRQVMPPGDGTPEDDFPIRAQRAVYGYVRGQLLFSLIMGTSAGVALWVFGRLGIFDAGDDYAFAFGAFFGLMELVPYVGPVLGALPPVIVALIDNPLTAVWVALLFLALQQLEGHVVAPQVFGRALRMNPLLVLFALLLGGEVYGILGALVALPIAAVGRETVLYLRRHMVLEPWGGPGPGGIGMQTRPPRQSPEPEATAAGDSQEEAERLPSMKT